jgi:hypothetical protein
MAGWTDALYRPAGCTRGVPWPLLLGGIRHGWDAGKPDAYNLAGLIPVFIGFCLLSQCIMVHFTSAPHGWRIERTPHYPTPHGVPRSVPRTLVSPLIGTAAQCRGRHTIQPGQNRHRQGKAQETENAKSYTTHRCTNVWRSCQSRGNNSRRAWAYTVQQKGDCYAGRPIMKLAQLSQARFVIQDCAEITSPAARCPDCAAPSSVPIKEEVCSPAK